MENKIDSKEGEQGISSNGFKHLRDKWKKKIDFAFAIAGGFVGLGNVWRFPYLCYKNGGGAFLIPYVIFVAIGSLPVFFLEVTLGQFTNRGSALAFGVVPIMKGVSLAVNVINFNLNVYYAVILAWSLRYFFASMSSVLPWVSCENEWNTEKCFVYGKNLSSMQNGSFVSDSTLSLLTYTTNLSSSVQEFWERGVLSKSSGVGEVGTIQWDLFGCLFLTWIVLYFCVWRGIGWTSKVVYVTATFPLLMLLILLVRGLTLDGAVDGLVFYLKPNVTRLSDVQILKLFAALSVWWYHFRYHLRHHLEFDSTRKHFVRKVWLDAATQVFYSYALCKGMLITMGSYNLYHYNSYRDCIVLSFLNSGVSFVSGLAIFSVLGFMAKEQIYNILQPSVSICFLMSHPRSVKKSALFCISTYTFYYFINIDIAEVAESGPGLAFIAYPKALTLLPLPQLWGCLFFFMLFLLGLDSEFVGLESMISAFVDLKPMWFKKPWRRETFLAFLCLMQFVIGISMITNGGVYVLNIFDNYAAAGWCLLFISFCQCIALSWLFGIDKYWNIVCDMIGFKPRLNWFKWCWYIITPLSTMLLIVVSIIYYKPLTYNKTYVYPSWAVGVAWLLAMTSMIWIPGYAIYRFCFLAKGTLKERLKEVITSEFEEPNKSLSGSKFMYIRALYISIATTLLNLFAAMVFVRLLRGRKNSRYVNFTTSDGPGASSADTSSHQFEMAPLYDDIITVEKE